MSHASQKREKSKVSKSDKKNGNSSNKKQQQFWTL